MRRVTLHIPRAASTGLTSPIFRLDKPHLPTVTRVQGSENCTFQVSACLQHSGKVRIHLAQTLTSANLVKSWLTESSRVPSYNQMPGCTLSRAVSARPAWEQAMMLPEMTSNVPHMCKGNGCRADAAHSLQCSPDDQFGLLR